MNTRACDNDYCLILAGGIGSRLWPVSRKSRPKQFLDLFGVGRTLLQQTYDRFARFMAPGHIYVSTNVDYLDLVHEQLPELEESHILEEPLHRGTLASVAWGTVVISKLNERANIVVTPSDQMIVGEEAFADDMVRSLSFAAGHEDIVVMGVEPARAETNYGYIQMGDQAEEGAEEFFTVKSFTEKPEEQFAEMFIREGGFLWNVGIVAFNVRVMLRTTYKLVPEYQLEIPRMMEEAETTEGKSLPGFFSMLPNLSIDLGILERSGNVISRRCHFGWADLGTWATLRPGGGIDRERGDDREGNVTLDTRTVLHDCHGCVVSLPQGRIAIVEGLDDYLVAEQGDVLLICPKAQTTVRRLMTDAQLQLGTE